MERDDWKREGVQLGKIAHTVCTSLCCSAWWPRVPALSRRVVAARMTQEILWNLNAVPHSFISPVRTHPGVPWLILGHGAEQRTVHLQSMIGRRYVASIQWSKYKCNSWAIHRLQARPGTERQKCCEETLEERPHAMALGTFAALNPPSYNEYASLSASLRAQG